MGKCRNCESTNVTRFLDLGASPLANAYLSERDLSRPEIWYPLRVQVCGSCWLAQTEDPVSPREVFTEDYAYFSSTSDSWLTHSQQYMGDVVHRFALGDESFVVEVASNDGYLLQYFNEARIRTLGIEPTRSTALVAESKGVETLNLFLDTTSVRQIVADYGTADLVVANNVLAHVPDIADFATSLRELLAESGVLTVEFPALSYLIDRKMFDTVYHEHFSYLSLYAVMQVFARAGLTIFDVQSLATHGGSLRVFAQRTNSGVHPIQASVQLELDRETSLGLLDERHYLTLQAAAEEVKVSLLKFLLRLRESGESIAAYGAAAKGNTLLNFAGVRSDLLPFVVDRSPSKVGKFLPGSRIPIRSTDELMRRRPENLLILPWNIAREVTHQVRQLGLESTRAWTSIPELKEVE